MAHDSDELAMAREKLKRLLADNGRSFVTALPSVEDPLWITVEDEESLVSLVADFLTDPS